MSWKMLIVAPLVMLLLGCATSKRLQKLETKIEVLENKVNSVEQRQSAIEGQTGESRESVGYLKGKVEGLPKGPSTVVITGNQGQGNEGFVNKSGKVVLTNKGIQITLKNAGFYKGPIDGKLGKETKKAIKEFQRANGLHADGVVGKKTRALLIQYWTQEPK